MAKQKMPETAAIDRIEDSVAYLDSNGEIFELNARLLPKNAKEGMVINLQDDKYFIDKSASRKAKEEVRTLLNDIFNVK